MDQAKRKGRELLGFLAPFGDGFDQRGRVPLGVIDRMALELQPAMQQIAKMMMIT